MSEINVVQYRMLKRINRLKRLDRRILNDNENEICKFLCEKKFVLYQCDCDYGDPASLRFHINKEWYVITQEGKAQIYSFKSTFYKIRVSLILSVISTIAAAGSTIVAIIALLMQLQILSSP